MKVIVSACLLGVPCRYKGGANTDKGVISFVAGMDVIPVCPDVAAGMPIPRPPVEILRGRIVRKDGTDMDEIYRAGARKIMKEIEGEDIAFAILKARSPTCGVHEVYDGTFSGTRVPGEGVLAAMLKEAGIPAYDEEDLAAGRIPMDMESEERNADRRN